MSNRYWINGSGNWNDSVHWSEASGGISGATVPTSGDSVYFNDLSFTGTSIITINAAADCYDFIWTGITQNVSLTNSAYNLSIYGSLYLWTGLTVSFTSIGYLYLKSSVAGQTITSNGNTSGWNRIYFDGVGGTWTNQDDWNCGTSDFCLTNGTFDTNSKNIHAKTFSLQTGTKTLILGSSVLTLTGDVNLYTNSANLTINTDTSTIICSTIYTQNSAYYNIYLYNSYSLALYGLKPSSINNLTITPTTGNGIVIVNYDLLINNNLIINGYNSSANRLIIASSIIGTQRTITCNGTLTVTNADFRDIVGAGSASWDLSAITGLSGDCGGNSGITFTTAKKQYFKHTSGAVNWSDSSKWFSDETPRTTAGRVPLPQDDVIFDASSFTGTSTLTIDCPRIGRSLDMSGVDKNVTTQFASAAPIECYGSYILGNNITSPPYFSVYFMGRNNNYYLNTFNKTTNTFIINCVNGFYTFLSNYNTGIGQYFRILSGSVDFNDYNFSSGGYYFDGGTIYLGNGNIYATSNNRSSISSLYTLSASVIYPEESNIIILPSGGTNDITIYNKNFNNIILKNCSHNGNIIMYNSGTINNLIIESGRKLKIQNGTKLTLGNLISVSNSGSTIIFNSLITGSTYTLSGSTSDWLVERAIIQDSIVSPPQYAGFYSTDGGNNTGWTFGESSARYWVGNTGNWNDTSHWSYETGGATGATIPGSGQTVFFDSNSFSGTSTVTINSEANCNHFIWTGLTQSVTLVNAAYNLSVYGDLTLCSGLTWSFTATGYLYLKSSKNSYITSNGVIMNGNIYLDGAGSWTNIDDWNCSTSLIRPYNGTWNTNDKTITCLQIRFQTGASTMNCGNSTITGLQQFWADNGTHDFNCDTSTFIFNTNLAIPNFTFAPAYNVIIKGSADINYYAEVWSNINILNDLTLSGYNSTNYRSIIRTPTYGTKSSITVGGAVSASNFDFMDIIGVGSDWDLSNAEGGSGDCGGNSGITFTSGQTQYWYQGSGSWSDSSKWFLDSSGITPGRTPLPQDDTIFDENSFSGGTSIITASHSRLGKNLNMSGVTNTVNLLLNNGVYIFGDLILGDNIEQTGTNGFYLFGRNNLSINLYSKTIYSLYCYAPGAIVTVLSNLNITATLSIGNCYFYFNDFDSYVGYLSYPANSYKYGYVYMGSGTMTLNRTNSYFQTSASQHLYTEQSTIKFVAPYTSNDYGYINCGTAGVLKTFNNIWITGEKNSYVDLTGVFTINELVIDKGRKVRFTNNTNTTLNSLVTNGTSYSGVTLCSYLSGSTYTLTKTSGTSIVDVKYATISDSIANGLYARASIDGGNNSGWTFNYPKFWIGGSGNTNDISHWSDTSGGVSGTTFMGVETVVGGNFESGLIGTRTDGAGSVSTWTLNTSGPISGSSDGLLNVTVSPTGSTSRPTLYFVHSSILAYRWIRFSFNYKVNSGIPIMSHVYDGSSTVLVNAQLSGSGYYYYDFQYKTDRTQIISYWRSDSGVSYQVQLDNISVKEIYLLPTPSTDVFFDENSFSVAGQTVTINEQMDCSTLDFEDLSNSMTLSNSAYNLNVYGSLFLSDKLNTNFTSTGYLYLKSTTSCYIQSSGNTSNFNRIYIDGIGGIWNITDSYSHSTVIYFANGTLNTNGYYFKCSVWVFFSPGTFTFNLSDSYLDIYSIQGATTTYIMNAGTSTIYCHNTGYFSGANHTFNNLIFENFTSGGYISSFTCNNLDIIKSNINPIYNGVYINENVIINENLTIIGLDDNIGRIMVGSYFGTQRKITIGGILSASNVDFRDIYLSGNTIFDLSDITGGSGDCGGNSGITFTSGQTQYFYTTGSTANWSDTNNWFLNSSGLTHGRFPLPQDIAIFDENSFLTGCTLDIDCPRIGGDVDMSDISYSAITLSLKNNTDCYGSFILGDNITQVSGSYTLFLYGRKNHILNTYNKSIYNINIYSQNGIYINESDINLRNNMIIGYSPQQGNGTFDFNDYNLVARYIQFYNPVIIYLGNGIFTLTANGGTIFTNATDNFYPEGSTIKISITSGESNTTISNYKCYLNRLWISKTTHNGFIIFSVSTIMNELTVEPGRKICFTEGTTQTIKYLNAVGTSDSGITIGSVTTGLTHSLSGITNNWAVEYATISDSIVSPTQKAGLYSTDGGNNTGWTFGETNLRYWVGNTGNWNDTSHWSYESGGATGATIPTSGNSVYFDLNSFTTGSTITINAESNCNDFIWTGITQNVTLTNSAYNLNVYGDLVLDAKLSTSFTSTGYLYFKSTSAGKTITSNGNASSWNGIYFDGIGGEWTHMDNFSAGTTNIIFVNGTWNTNNKTITISYDFASVGSAIRVLNLGSSTINCLKWTVGNPITGITINVGTSKIVATGNYCYFSNLTWYDFESTNSGDFQVRGWSGTFHNFTKTNGNLTFAVGGLYITVNGTLTLNGTNGTTGRMLVYSESLGTQRTITCNGTLSVSNADFRDIKGAGSASWDLSSITGLSGDGGGNSGITFTTAQKQYFKHTSGAVNWSDATKWFSDETPRTSAGRVPLPQDDVQFDASSFTGTSTLSVNVPRIGRSLDMSAVNQAVTFSLTSTIEVYGNFILGSNITPSGSYYIYPYGRSNFYLNTFSKILRGIDFYAFGGSYTNMSHIVCSSFLMVHYGDFYLNDFDLTSLGSFVYFGKYYLGNGTITCTSNSAGDTFGSVGGTIYCGLSTVKFSPTLGSNSLNFRGYGFAYNKVWFTGNHTGTFDILGSNTIAELIIDAGRKVRFTPGTTTTFNSLISRGTPSSGITITTITTGSTFTLSNSFSGYTDVKYTDISYSIANNLFARASIDGGNNTGWTFNVPRFWVGDSGNIADPAHWALTSGGVSGETTPTSSNDIFFDENSFSTGSTITVNNTFSCGAIDFEGINQNVSLINSAYNFNVYGSLIFWTGLTTSFTSTGYLYLKSNYHQFLRTSGVTTSFNRLFFDSTGLTMVNADDWYNDTNMFMDKGTWYTNNKTITFGIYCDLLCTGNGSGGSINLGSSNLYINSLKLGTNNYLDAGTSNIFINKRTYAFINYCIVLYKAFTFNNIIINYFSDYSSVNGIDGINMQGSTISNLIYNGYSCLNQSLIMLSDFTVTDTLTLSGYNNSNYRLIVRSDTLGTKRTITTNNAVISNTDFRDIRGDGSFDWILTGVTGGSGDCGGNSGITFTSGQTQYFYTTGTTVSWSSVSNWFLNSSGITQGRVPLPQDDAIFDENSFNQATTTLNIDCQTIGKNLNMSSINKTIYLTVSNAFQLYGDLKLSSHINSISGSYNVSLMGRNNHTIDMFEKSFGIMNINAVSGKYTALSNINTFGFNTSTFALNSGTFDANDYDITTWYFYITAGILYMGNGTWTMTSNGSTAGFTYNLGTIYCEQSILKMNPSSGSSNIQMILGNKTYNKLWLSGSHTGYYDITGSNTFNEILIDPGRKVRFQSGKTQTSKYFNAIGISGNTISIGSITTGSTHSLIRTSDNWYLDYCVIQDSVVSPDTNAGFSSINGGNNSGWTFNSSSLKYWIGDSGDWGDTSHWSYSIGGASGATLPLSSDKVFFNEYSFSVPSSINIDIDANCYDMLWTGVTQSVTISNTGHTLNIYNDVTLYSGVTWDFSGTGYLYLRGVANSNITANGSILNVNRLYFSGDSNWINLDDLDLRTSDIYHVSGTWLTNGQTITTTGKYYTTGLTLKYLDLSTSTLNIGSYVDEYGVQLSAGTSQINISDFNSIFKGYDNTFYNVKFINGAYIYNNNIFNNLEISNDNNIDYKLQLYGNQNINGILTLSGTNSTNYRLLVTSNEFNVQRSLFASDVLAYNVDFRDIVSDGSFDWDLSAIIGGSGDWGGNSGITFTTAQDQYLYSSGGTINWGDESVWFLGSGGSGGNGRMPLAQDNVIIDESFTSALEGYINFDIGDKIYCNDFDCCDINKFLFVSDNGDIPINIKGNLYLSPMFEFEQRTNIIKLVCRDSSTASLENSLLGIVSFLYGDYTIYGNTECESFQVYSDAKVTIYSQEIEITGEYSPALYIGGNNSYDTTSWCDGTTFKIDETGSSNIQIQPFSNDANCNIWLTGSITGDYEIKSDIPATTYYINYLLVDPGKSIKTSSGLTINFNNFSAVGTVESGITIGTIESGYTSTFNYTGPIVNKPVIYGQYLSISDSVATPSSIWYAGPTSTDLGNNSGWIFSLRGRLILYDSKLVLNKPTSSHPLLFTNHFLL